jgi:hypothetical protein
MGDIDKFMRLLRRQIRAVDREIVSCVRAQSRTTTTAAAGASATALPPAPVPPGDHDDVARSTNNTNNSTNAEDDDDLAAAEERAAELARRVATIQRRAGDAERLVQEICRDVRRLDRAKRHLTSAVTSLRRLAMLTAAVDDLEAASARRDQYRRCADLLEAVAQLREGHFSGPAYGDVPKIRALGERVAAVQARLTDAALDDFRLLLGAADARVTPEAAERLQGACAVVSALGPRVRDRVMDWLSEREVGVYTAVFSASATDARMLDRFERRYAWYRQRLEDRRDVWAVFPASWRVPQTITLAFCKVTKAALARLLSDTPREALAGAEGVAPLIRAVVATNKFERDMAARFGGGGAGGDGGEDDDGGDGGGGGGPGGSDAAAASASAAAADDSLPATEARRRLEVYRRRQQAEKAAAEAADKAAAAAAVAAEPGASPAAAAAAAAAETEAAAAAAAAAAAVRVAFEGSISDAFEASLLAYVDEEERELMAHLHALVRQEHERRWLPVPDDDAAAAAAAARDAAALMGATAQAAEAAASASASLGVLASANQLFLKVRASLTRCTRLVSRGPALVALAGAFRRVLAAYAGELAARLPRAASGQGASAVAASFAANGAFPPLGATDWHVRLPEAEEAVVGCILHTAEHCRETAEALGAAIAREVRPAALAHEVDFSDEASAFVGLASQCLSVLGVGLATRLDGALAEMARARWDAGLDGAGAGPDGGSGGPSDGGRRGDGDDESPFVLHVRRALADAAARLGPVLDRPQLGFFCDKLARAFPPRFLHALHRLRKPVGPLGAQQLAVDVDAVKRALLDFPRAARLAALGRAAGGATAAAAASLAAQAQAEARADAAPYLRLAERDMAAAVALVKVMQARPEHVADAYSLLMPAHLQTPGDFARACEACGFTRKLAGELMALYARRQEAGGGGGGGAGGAGATAGSGGGGGGGMSPTLGRQQQPAQVVSPSAAAFAAAASASARQNGTAGSSHQQTQQQPARRPGGERSGGGGGGGGGAGGGLAGAAGGGLAALKSSVNSFTRELASSMSVGAAAAGGRGPSAGGAGVGGGGGGGGGAPSSTSAVPPAGGPEQQQQQQQQPGNKLLSDGRAGLQAAGARLGQLTSNLASRLGGE